MMRKKQILIQTKEPLAKPSAKVTVQYIQPHRQSDVDNKFSSENQILSHKIHFPADTEELEAENVEYLDDHTAVEGFVEVQDPVSIVKQEDDDECEDSFYPNAIHCMLDLYKDIYENLIKKSRDSEMNNLSYIWHDIAKEMQKSYFEFNADQIRRKFCSLREQYFMVRNCNDLENFEYFEEMHDIYKDPGREMLLKGGEKKQLAARVIYKDEDLMKVEDNNHNDGFKSQEIVHKEHEFIDMVEKELQAMEQVEDSKQDNKAVLDKMNDKSAIEKIRLKNVSLNLKRHLDKDSKEDEERTTQKPKLNEDNKEKFFLCTSKCSETKPIDLIHRNSIGSNESPEKFTLYDYNLHQERRHQEQLQILKQQQKQQSDQLSIIEKTFKLQERALEQQNQLLQELIKRLPPK